MRFGWLCYIVQTPGPFILYWHHMSVIASQITWWRHQMETFSAQLALCAGNSGPGEFPTQRPVTRSFDVFFDLRLNKRLSKQPWGWWFETPSWSLWRQCNVVTALLVLCDSNPPVYSEFHFQKPVICQVFLYHNVVVIYLCDMYNVIHYTYKDMSMHAAYRHSV